MPSNARQTEHAPSPPLRMVYSIAQTAEALGFGRNKVYEEISAGRLRSFKAGRRRMIAAEDLRAYIDALRGAAQ